MLEKEVSSPKTKQRRGLRTAIAASTGGRRGLNAREERGVTYTALWSWQLWYPSSIPLRLESFWPQPCHVLTSVAFSMVEVEPHCRSCMGAISLAGNPGSSQIRADVRLLMSLSSLAPPVTERRATETVVTWNVKDFSPRDWQSVTDYKLGKSCGCSVLGHLLSLQWPKVVVELQHVTHLSPKPGTPPKQSKKPVILTG